MRLLSAPSNSACPRAFQVGCHLHHRGDGFVEEGGALGVGGVEDGAVGGQVALCLTLQITEGVEANQVGVPMKVS